MVNFIISPPDSSLLYAGNYDFILVGLSAIVAIFASYAALLVSQHVTTTTLSKIRHLWLLGGSLCLGIGVWSMHFVGMLAFNLPCSTSYDPILTLISTLPSILASAVALEIISQPKITALRLASGGLLIGAGIGAMHYSGMAAMHLNGLIRYNIQIFLLSLLIAVVLATLALWVKFKLQSLQNEWSKWNVILSATVMGVAVSGMHYTAMAAAYFVRGDDNTLSTTGISPTFLASIVLTATGLITVITITTTYINRPSLLSFKRFYKLICVLLAVWSAIAWLIADYYYVRQAQTVYQQEIQLATQQAAQVASNLDDNIEQLKGIALVFAHSTDIRRALHRVATASTQSPHKPIKTRWTQDKILSQLNNNLSYVASNLGADVIYLLNINGDCIVSSNADKPDSFVSTNYADRDYFRLARQGESGHQYAVGRASKIPGLFYSRTVFDKGQFFGVVVVKRNITQFLHWTNQTNTFLTDANGVIVLSSDKDIEYHSMPGAPVAKLSEARILLQYKQSVIEPLTITQWNNNRFPSAVLARGKPVVFTEKILPEDAITVYSSRPLDRIIQLSTEKNWLFLLLASAGSMLIIAASAILLYLHESRTTAADLRIAASAFEAQEGMMITNITGTILRVNKAFIKITGYSIEDAINQNATLLNSDRHDELYNESIWTQIGLTGNWEGEIWSKRKNGEIYPQYLSVTAVKDKNSTVTHYVHTFNDISTKKAAADEIKYLAFYDSLTGLPNRRLLTDRLVQAVASSLRSEQQGALLFIDLDNFKVLNDTLGHDIGDLLLKKTAQRLIDCMRDGDTVARLGGDEFVVIMENLSTHALEAAAHTRYVAQKILAKLNLPYQLNTYSYHNTPSIGATIFGSNNAVIDELFKQSDIAMYQAKKAGRNTLRFFDPVMQENINIRATLEAELRNALEQQQFRLYYQIQVNDAHLPIGAEALIRWHHPERGIVSPAQFIPLTEDTGLILPIGLWVLDTACSQLKKWQQNSHTCDLVLAVNVSAYQFRQDDFVAQVQATLQKHQINATRLKLELTESLLLDNVEAIITTMTELKKTGVQFSLDDFGTGYSSLEYLKRLPLDQLKIDKSFVRDITVDSNDKAIVRTIIVMARSLNLDVIAEGVETAEQQQLLLNKGCTRFQGYLFGKPVPINEFDALVEQKLS